MRKTICAMALALLLAGADDAFAAPRNCGTLRINGGELPVQITRGNVSCSTARRAIRRFLPVRGRGRQLFMLARRRWFCADSHGRELTNGGVAHCLSGRVRVMLKEPAPEPEPTPRRAPPTVVTPPATPPVAPVPVLPVPSPPPPGSSRENPIPLGSTAAIGPWAVTVLGFTQDAWPELQRASEYNDPPAAGRQYVMVRLRATYTGTGSSSFLESGGSRNLVGLSNLGYASYDSYCSVVVPQEFDASRDVFTGGSLEGDTCWSVSAEDAVSPTFYVDGDYSGKNRTFFALR